MVALRSKIARGKRTAKHGLEPLKVSVVVLIPIHQLANVTRATIFVRGGGKCRHSKDKQRGLLATLNSSRQSFEPMMNERGTRVRNAFICTVYRHNRPAMSNSFRHPGMRKRKMRWGHRSQDGRRGGSRKGEMIKRVPVVRFFLSAELGPTRRRKDDGHGPHAPSVDLSHPWGSCEKLGKFAQKK